MKTTLGILNISKTRRFFKFEKDPVSTFVHLSNCDILSVSNPSRYLKSPLMTKVIGFFEMSRYFRFLNFVQAEVNPKLRFGMSLCETSSERREGLFKISSLRTEMELWERLRWVKKGVSRTGTVMIPVPAMFNRRTVFGSFNTFLMDSSVSGLKLRSISLMLTRILASEGMLEMELYEIIWKKKSLVIYYCRSLFRLYLRKLPKIIYRGYNEKKGTVNNIRITVKLG